MYFELKKNMQVILNKSGDYNYQKQSTKLLPLNICKTL